MTIPARDAASMLQKYASERTPVLATLVGGKQFATRVSGVVRSEIIDGAPFIFIGKDEQESDFIKFCLVNCQYEYGDLREASILAAEKMANRIEAILVVATTTTEGTLISLTLYEMKT